MSRTKVGCLAAMGVIGSIFFVACSVSMISGVSDGAKVGSSTPATARAEAPAPAPAPDLTDAAYLLTLDNHHISYSSPQAALKTAHGICDQLDSGATMLDVVSSMQKGAPAGYSLTDLGYIFGASVAAYCPKYDSEIPNN